MRVTSLGSRLAFLQAAAIRSLTSLSLSANGDRLATQYSFGLLSRDYKGTRRGGIVQRTAYAPDVREISSSDRAIRQGQRARSWRRGAGLCAANERVAGEIRTGCIGGAAIGSAKSAHPPLGDSAESIPDGSRRLSPLAK